VAHLAQPRQVLWRAIDRAAPIERLVLRVALAQAPGDFRLHQFGAEIEGVRRIVSELELREERECVLRHAMAVAVIAVNAVFRRLDAEIGVGDLRGQLGDLRRRVGERLLVVQLQQRAGARQVKDARLAVATGYGMTMYRYGGTAAAAVLERAP